MTFDCLLHVHSSFSYDSKTDLATIAARARKEGIRCVLMAEHNNFMNEEQTAALVQRCAELSGDGLLIVPGLELAFSANRIHLLAFGIRRYIDSSSDGVTFASLIQQIHAEGGIAVLAHPSHRQASTLIDPRDLQHLDGIEIWNVKNGNRFVPTSPDLQLLERVRTAGGRAFGFAGLDWHHANRFCRLVLRVEAAELSRDAVFAALRQGRFAVHGRFVRVPAAGDARPLRLAAYHTFSRLMQTSQRTAYRWQSALERKGVRIPNLVIAAARRIF
jgi:predicted metal-dependent phosphoesterase TrpH